MRLPLLRRAAGTGALALVLAAAPALAAGPASASSAATTAGRVVAGTTPAVPAQHLAPVHSDHSAPLRTILARRAASAAAEAPTVEDVPLRVPPPSSRAGGATGVRPSATAGGTATSTAPSTQATLGVHAEGLGAGMPGFDFTGTPPDTVGAVGATQYVEWVNSMFQVYDKTDGHALSVPADGNSLFTGFGGLCESTNDGDPQVTYDKLAGRWVLSQFANVSSASGPYYQCFAVSTTSDALGSYNRYAFSFGSQLNDYGKIGVWPSAYLLTANMFAPDYKGANACALDRAAMLAGQPSPTMNCQFIPASTNEFTLIPSDLDGSVLPAAGTPGYLVEESPTTWNGLGYRRITTGFDGAPFAVSSMVGLPTISNYASCYSSCVPQPGTTRRLDTLGGRLMYRLAYRVLNGVPTLLATASSNVSGGTWSPVWYRLTDTGSGLAVADSGYVSPDTTTSRFMGSAALDRNGNMLVGYTASDGTSTYPSVRVSGRLAGDPPGTTGGEQTLAAGGGSETGPYTRWGDYSDMSVDPLDDCTFWYVGEYQKTTGDSFSWHTSFGSFRYSSCARTTQSVAVTPTQPSLPKGTTQQMTATATYDDQGQQDVTSSATWSSSDSSVASVGPTGLVTAQSPGTATVSALSGGKTGSTVVTVTAAALRSVAVTPPTGSAPVGLTAQYTATGTYTDGSTAPVAATWSTSQASVATVDSTGLVTAVSPGDVTVAATVGSLSGSASFSATPAVPERVTVSPSGASLPVGRTQSYTATATYSDDSTSDVTHGVVWSTADASVATVDPDGTLHAVGEGSTSVAAALGSTPSDPVPVTVTSKVLDSLAVTPDAPAIAKGEDQPFTATGTYSDGSTSDLTGTATWGSSDTGVATIDASGDAQSVDVGSTTITATIGSVSDGTVLTVGEPEIVDVAVTPADSSLPAGTTQQYAATATLTDGTTEDVTSAVTWSTDDSSTATITSGGLLKGAAPGTTTVRAQRDSRTEPDDAYAAATSVTVTQAAVTSVSTSPATLSLPKGLTSGVTLTATYTDASTRDVSSSATWTSDDPSIATVDSTGAVHAVSVGSTTVHGSFAGFTDSTLVTVDRAVLKKITTHTEPSLYKGALIQFTARGTFSDGTSADVTRSATWRSGGPGVVTVGATGLAHGVSAGTTTITATLSGLSSSVSERVLPAVLSFSTLTPTSGKPGTVVTIRGQGLGNVQAVLLRGVPATVTSRTPTTIRATIPTYALTGPLELLTQHGYVLTSTFTVRH